MSHRLARPLTSDVFRKSLGNSLLVLALACVAAVPARAQAPSEPAPPPGTQQPQAQPQPTGNAPAQTPSQAPAQSQTKDQSKSKTQQASNSNLPFCTDQPADKPVLVDKDSSSGGSTSSTQTADANKDQPKPAHCRPTDAPVPQKDSPDVKSGSKQDVDSIGNRGVGKGVNFYSLDREIAMGKAAAQEIERSAKLVDDPVVTEYVNRVGQNLVRNSDAKVPFTIKVIDSDQINAMALPGGFFYVNSGLILAADSEAEVAGVMAHEIAHVAARHGTRTATKGELAQLATIPLILLGPGGWAGYGIYEGLQFAVPISFLKFNRDMEREADFLGLQYMYKAGYDPNAFVTFFEKIEAVEKRQPGTVPKLFSTHPPTPERVLNIQHEISTILPARDEYIVTTSEFDTVKARLRGIENRTKLIDKKQGANKPTLRTRTERTSTDDGSGNGNGNGNNAPADPSDDPDRPTLHKRSDDPADNLLQSRN